MIEEISDVTGYINQVFISDFLIPGDRLVFIQFYGKADLLYDEVITETSIKSIKDEIALISADGRFTDIGNALDTLNIEVEKTPPAKRRRYLILMTDGKQEAPEDSRYYSKDGNFNHEFLENTKIIQKKGWKIIILGIGADTAVRELSDELLTTYKELDFTKNTPAISNEEILGRIIAENLVIENHLLTIDLTSEGYSSTRTIEVEQILYQITSGNHELISSPVSISMEPGITKNISIQLDPEKINRITNKSEKGSILFNFEGDTPFLPAVWVSDIILSRSDVIEETSSEAEKNNLKKSGNSGFNWLILVIIVLVIAAIIAVILIRNTLSHRDDDEKRKDDKHEISSDN
jgi:hypothetical protein